MHSTTIASPTNLGDRQLLAEVQRLVRCERAATAALIASLAELDALKLYLGEGCSSLFTYCTQVLHLSEHAAYGRIVTDRAARRFPAILERLSSGELPLTAVGLLAPHLTIDNHRQLLESARYKSKRDIEQIVAYLRPQPPVATTVRKLPTPKLAPNPLPIASTAALESGIFDRALTLLLKELERLKCAATNRPRETTEVKEMSCHVPAAVKRAVWPRDDGRCAFVGSNGRYSERGFLEFHHVQPYAAGGETTIANIELRCRAHNNYEKDLFFGVPPMVRERWTEWPIDRLGPDRVGRSMRRGPAIVTCERFCTAVNPSRGR